MTDDLLDLALLLEVGKSPAGERAVDLEAVDKDGDSHQAVGLDILLELVGDGLVEDDGVLGLVLDCGSKSKVSETAHMSVLVLVFFGCLCVCMWVFGMMIMLLGCHVAYPCPLTTSSSASCRRLVRVPMC